MPDPGTDLVGTKQTHNLEEKLETEVLESERRAVKVGTLDLPPWEVPPQIGKEPLNTTG